MVRAEAVLEALQRQPDHGLGQQRLVLFQQLAPAPELVARGLDAALDHRPLALYPELSVGGRLAGEGQGRLEIAGERQEARRVAHPGRPVAAPLGSGGFWRRRLYRDL